MRDAVVETVVGVDRFPDDVRRLTTLDRVDYADLFCVPVDDARRRTPEEWARALLEEGAIARRSARRLWTALGLRLGPPGSPDHVQGWRIAGRGDDWITVETGSWYMSGQAVCKVDAGRVSIALFLRHDNPLAPAVWAPVSVFHRRAVPVMLAQAVAIVAGRGGGAQEAAS
ncbi:MAG TPA: hypothetical protein VNU01_00425 [Egibacteraceae bacterium]|nr:hypothetical protein [Egibacteraceae bacterium]